MSAEAKPRTIVEAIEACFRANQLGCRTAARLLLSHRSLDPSSTKMLKMATQRKYNDILLPSLRTPEDFPVGADVILLGQVRKDAYAVIDVLGDSIALKNDFSPYDLKRLPLSSLLYWGQEEFWDLRTREISASRTHHRTSHAILNLELALGLTSHSQEELQIFTEIMSREQSAIPKSQS